MKKLITIIIVFCSLASYSQSDSLYKEAEKLTAAKVYQDVKTGFSQLVTNLEGPAKHVYGVYVNQHRTVGIAKGIASIFSISVFLLIFLNYYKKAYLSEGNIPAILAIIGLAGFLIAVGATIFYFTGDFNKILNPEYYAIQDIIKTFK